MRIATLWGLYAREVHKTKYLVKVVDELYTDFVDTSDLAFPSVLIELSINFF